MTVIQPMTAVPAKPDVTGFFDAAPNTISYVVKDPGSRSCAVIALRLRASGWSAGHTR
jgi:hypothetical protein